MPGFSLLSRHPPAFWRDGGALPWVLAPVANIVSALTARRMARPGWKAPVPVLCCGNATVGGAGKTTVTLDLTRRLSARGNAVHVLLRGYGGSIRGPYRVGPGDRPELTGDEALLLSAFAPTWIGADRAASARAAVAEGAEILLMDDGLQNPTLAKTMSLLVVDGTTGFGNGQVLPAGPLREPVTTAAARCRAAVVIGADRSGVVKQLPNEMAILTACLTQDGVDALAGKRVLAFAAIAFPEKFFSGLEQAGVNVVGRAPFPDHHVFTRPELDRLRRDARKLEANWSQLQRTRCVCPKIFRCTLSG